MIEQVIGDYLSIQRKGRNYIANCPFHDDKMPSLTINPKKEIFKCFACGAGGNVVMLLSLFVK